MRMLATLTCNTIDSDDLVDVNPEKLVEGMNTLKTSIMAAVDFLEGQLKIRNVVFLPFPIMIIPIVSFFSKIHRPNALQLTQLKKWFWQCALTLRYKAGTNRLVMEDLSKMDKVANSETPFDNTTTTIPDDVFSSAWRINSTAAKAALCLMAQMRPKSFLSGSVVDLGSVLSAYNARQFHHIYPKAHLNTKGISFHAANVIANICFLSAAENNSISDKDPSEYFKEIPAEQKESIFDAAVIPIEARDGRLDFEEFVKARRRDLNIIALRLIQTGMV